MPTEDKRRDVDDLLRALAFPAAPDEAPAWPSEAEAEPATRVAGWRQAWRRWALGPVLAGAAAITLFHLIPYPDSEAPVRQDGLRGEGETPLPEVSLQLAVEREGQAVRLSSGGDARLGERVLFRVAAASATEVSLWVETPDGPQPIATSQVGIGPLELRAAGTLLAWELDQPGSHRFVASPLPMPQCPEPACASVIVVVE